MEFGGLVGLAGLRIGVRRWGGASGLEFGGGAGRGPQDWSSEAGGASGLEFGGGAGPQDWSSEMERCLRIGVRRWCGASGFGVLR